MGNTKRNQTSIYFVCKEEPHKDLIFFSVVNVNKLTITKAKKNHAILCLWSKMYLLKGK